MTLVLSEGYCEPVELTPQQADHLEFKQVIFCCDECSEPDRTVFHTTSDWDMACEDDGTDPVEAALEEATQP